MRFPAGYREQARKQLLESAARKAKKDGFGSTGIDSLAKAAGVTSGAVYSLFGSKDKLFSELVGEELTRSQAFLVNKSYDEALEGLKWYLSLPHVKDAESGCVMPALSVEIGRAAPEVRQVYERKIMEIQQAARSLTEDDAASWALVAQAVGAVVIARAMCSDDARETLLKAVLEFSERMLHR